MTKKDKNESKWTRRDFVKGSLAAGSVAGASLKAQAGTSSASPLAPSATLIDSFQRPDSLHAGDLWETLNPGYWKLENGALRRRLRNFGDRVVPMQLPWDWQLVLNNPSMILDAVDLFSEDLGDLRESIRAKASNPEALSQELRMKLFPELDYFKDPTLPEGMLWRSDWKLKGNFGVRMEATIKDLNPGPGEEDDVSWKMFSPEYGFLGICFGGDTFNEGFNLLGSALVAAWFEDGHFGIFQTQKRKHKYLLRQGLDNEQPFHESAFETLEPPRPGDRVSMDLTVTGNHPDRATVTAELTVGTRTARAECGDVARKKIEGYFGVSGRGLLDFEVNRLALDPGENRRLTVGQNDLHVCYPLGDTLREVDGKWRVRFVALFRSDGKKAAIRISDQPDPSGGWSGVPIAGQAGIVNSRFRRNTAIIQATLPFSPADRELYFTVWKDGEDVTADRRVGTAATGPGTGLLGNTPSSGNYVGRLPRLQAPYRVCGLSCHKVWGSGCHTPAGGTGCELIMDQPWPESFQHHDEYGFQILLWEDDMWYLEFPLFPPSTDDAYRSIYSALAGPTSRHQLMRHWVVMNPGDHDFGFDDLAGPIQHALRYNQDLGPMGDYLQGNMQIVAHLMMGDEDPSATKTPRFWRQWKMPGRDFTLLTVDSRLWRSTAEKRLWRDNQWADSPDVFDRHSPLRTILGEEQFAWLQQIVQTDTSQVICVSGINVLNAIYNQLLGPPVEGEEDFRFFETNCFDFAGWRSAAAGRLMKLFGSREGVVAVYGDLHHAGISRNVTNNVIEAHFGHTENSGYLRAPKHDFARRMTDFNGEEVEVISNYHQYWNSLELTPRPQRPDRRRDAQNFMEMAFDTRLADPRIQMKIRHTMDAPENAPRGGGTLDVPLFETGRRPASVLPEVKTLPSADVILYNSDGAPIRGMRTREDGSLALSGLVDIPPGREITLVCRKGTEVDAQTLHTRNLE